MRTIRQVAELTGISVRTLQYYDEIGLLEPSERTPSGYRLYNEEALQKLQQILLFRELGFKLKDIREIIEKPDFDRIAAFRKQKELLILRRDRTDRLIRLLAHLEKGESYMSFKEFDLSDYIHALEDFKATQAETVAKHWGSIENFDLFIQKIREDEENVAKLAIQQFGSTEKYTEAMKNNLEHFSETMENQLPEEARKIGQQADSLYEKLTSDFTKDAGSPEVQAIVRSLLLLFHAASFDKPYIQVLIQAYSSDYVQKITDTKYGEGACDYIVRAFRYYEKAHFS